MVSLELPDEDGRHSAEGEVQTCSEETLPNRGYVWKNRRRRSLRSLEAECNGIGGRSVTRQVYIDHRHVLRGPVHQSASWRVRHSVSHPDPGDLPIAFQVGSPGMSWILAGFDTHSSGERCGMRWKCVIE